MTRKSEHPLAKIAPNKRHLYGGEKMERIWVSEAERDSIKESATRLGLTVRAYVVRLHHMATGR